MKEHQLKFDSLPTQNDREGFERMFAYYYPYLLAYGKMFVDDQAVEDIIQEIMLFLWKNADTIKIHTSLESYLFKSVYLRCLNYIKQRNVQDAHKVQIIKNMDRDALRALDPDRNELIRKLFMDELRKEIDEAIASLSAKCREAFVLSYIHAMKNKEIALLMNVSERTIETHIYNALKVLRIKLKDQNRF